MEGPTSRCALCGEENAKLHRHHVTPKCKGGKHGDVVLCCATCSQQVHMLFNERELAAMSLADLFATDSMRRYLSWKPKHPGVFKASMSRKVRGGKR